MVAPWEVFYQAALDNSLKSSYRLDSGYSKALSGPPEGWCISLGSLVSKQSALDSLGGSQGERRTTLQTDQLPKVRRLTQERGQTAVFSP